MIKMENYGKSVEANHNSHCPSHPDHLYMILFNGCSGSGKS